MVKAEAIPNEQRIFVECWNTLKECYHTKTAEDWQHVHARAGDVVRLAGNDKALRDLAEGLFLTVAAYLEARQG